MSKRQEEYIDALIAATQDFSEDLEKETSNHEYLAGEAVRLAEPVQKLSALNTELEKWTETICVLARAFYNTCFKLALAHRDELGGEQPADVASRYTSEFLSLSLRVTSLNGQERDSDGRVREFVRRACEDVSVVHECPSAAPFQLPYWATRRSFGSKIASTDSEFAQKLVLTAEARLLAAVRSILTRAHRKAVIETGQLPPLLPTNTIAAQPLKTSKRSDEQCLRLSVIFKAIESGKRGLEYCSFLGQCGLATPESWRIDRCPESYQQAYLQRGRLGRLCRSRIYKEKSRYRALRSKLELENPAELRRILALLTRVPTP